MSQPAHEAYIWLVASTGDQAVRDNTFAFTSENSHLQPKPCFYTFIYVVKVHILRACSHLLLSNQMWWDCLTTIQRGVGGLVKESFDGVWVSWRLAVSELHPRVSVAPPSAVLVKAADRSCQTWLPPVALWHRLCNAVSALGVCEGLVVDNLAWFCDAEYSNLSSYMRDKHEDENKDHRALSTAHIEQN